VEKLCLESIILSVFARRNRQSQILVSQTECHPESPNLSGLGPIFSRPEKIQALSDFSLMA